MKRGLVVDGDLFTWFYVTQSDEKNVFVMDLHESVGLAGMIYVVRAITKLAAVQTPSFIDPADPQPSAAGPATRFGSGYEFTSVLSNFSAPLEACRRKTTLSLYR